MINYQFEHFTKNFFDKWQSGASEFEFATSGSTGSKKKITLSRDQLTYSARATMNYLDPEGKVKSTLLCIRPDFIGGTMVLVRATLFSQEINYADPASDILRAVGNQQFDLVSLVPLQVKSILDTSPEQIHQFGIILIGGAPLGQDLIERLRKSGHPWIYQSYGMTETASHIALKNLQTEEHYTTLGDVEISTDEDSRLKIKGSVTRKEWIQTNDRVNLVTSNTFDWLGRADNVINTGGIKVFPEEVETILQRTIKVHFFITGTSDDRLGSSVTLVVETSVPASLENYDFNSLPEFSRPRKILTFARFIYTETGKINRPETLKLLHE